MVEIAVVSKRIFDARPEEVFHAWTDPKEFAEWHGPEGFKNIIHHFDVREGGTYRFSMVSPSGEESSLQGTFVTVEPPYKLSFTWQWVDPGSHEAVSEQTLVSVEFKSVEGKTEMTFVQSGFATEKVRDGHKAVWDKSFDRLEQLEKN